MTKVLLAAIRTEFETTEITIEEIKEKYSCTTKDLKGYTKWTKNILAPETEKEQTAHIDTHLRLVYETLYEPQITDHLVNDTIEVGEIVDDFDTDSTQETKDIISASKDIQKNMPKGLDSKFKTLKILDTNMQNQAQRLLDKIDELLPHVDETKHLKELVDSNAKLRDSYFNTQAPMINVINGDVQQNSLNVVQELMGNMQDDC